jgi:hypothetical protein
MGWASEDDYDDSITVWEETVPAPNPADRKTPTKKAGSFVAVLEPPVQDEPSDERDGDVFYGEPTLKLDVQQIEVFRIKAVTYNKATRRVSRYRYPRADDKLL